MDRQTDGQRHRIKPPSLKYKQTNNSLPITETGQTDKQMDSANALSRLR